MHTHVISVRIYGIYAHTRSLSVYAIYTETCTKVSRILGGMASSSILGRTWWCPCMKALDWRRRGSHIRQWRTWGWRHPWCKFPRSAASWLAWRAVASLAARNWRRRGSHIRECTLRGPKVSRIPSGMTGSSMDWLRRGSHIRECTLRGPWPANQRDMLANKPCRTVRPLANTVRCTWQWAWAARHESYGRHYSTRAVTRQTQLPSKI